MYRAVSNKQGQHQQHYLKQNILAKHIGLLQCMCFHSQANWPSPGILSSHKHPAYPTELMETAHAKHCFAFV